VRFVVDEENLGTSAETWSTSQRPSSTKLLAPKSPDRVVVVAPHPDDEILGVGGLLQEFHRRGVDILIVAVTDGEASHTKSELAKKIDLRSIRAKESRVALQRLGISKPEVIRLRIPDGQVTANVERLEAELLCLLSPSDLCLAPWDKDGHPDHDASGIAVQNVAAYVGNDVLNYLVWALHWGDPEGNDLPWHACRRHELSMHQCARKRRATLAFRSQIRPIGRSRAQAPVLPLDVLRRHWLDYEFFIDPSAIPYGSTETDTEIQKELA
jgi:LmbE family N-acetylglucosaminyl deacetylase